MASLIKHQVATNQLLDICPCKSVDVLIVCIRRKVGKCLDMLYVRILDVRHNVVLAVQQHLQGLWCTHTVPCEMCVSQAITSQ